MVSIQIAALLWALSSGGETVLLDFQAPWCGPCRTMDPVVGDLEKAGYPVRKVNIDRERSLAERFQVQAIPCFVLVVNGQEAGRITGAVQRAELLSLFTKAGVAPGGAQQIARSSAPDAAAPRLDGNAWPGSNRAPSGSVPAPPAPDGNSFALARHDRATTANILPVRMQAMQPQVKSVGTASVAASPQNSDPNYLVVASVKLTIEDPQGTSHGTGTLVDARQGEALVLTCGHLFRDSNGQGRITVELCDPRSQIKVPGRLVTYDLKSDLALVSLRPGVPVNIAPVAPHGCRISKGDPVVTVGCDHGGPASAISSKINSLNKFLPPANLQVAGMPVQGRSGGGLFNQLGQVIGVCNAADPTDNEGLYAALESIHEQLDRAGLTAIYEAPSLQGEPSAVAESEPFMPSRLPTASVTPPVVARNEVQARNEVPARNELPARIVPRGDVPAGLSDGERKAMAQVASAAASGAEVICIVRPLADPSARSEVIKLDRASSAFLRQLAADQEAQDLRHPTSHEVRPPITTSGTPARLLR